MFELDNFVLDKDTSLWKIELCNGDILYEDDNRPDAFPGSAWLRLKIHCESYNLSIRKVWIVFRDQVKLIFDEDDCLSSDGIYFTKVLNQGFGGTPQHSYLFGRVLEDNIFTLQVKVPELLDEEEDTRLLLSYEGLVIWNTAVRKNIPMHKI